MSPADTGRVVIRRRRLVADFIWQRGTSRHAQVAPATVNPSSGALRILAPRKLLYALGISRDGGTILAHAIHGIVTLSYSGRSLSTLVKGAGDGDWTR